MNLPNKLTVMRILLVPVMVIIAIIGIQGDWLGVRYRVLDNELYIYYCFNHR